MVLGSTYMLPVTYTTKYILQNLSTYEKIKCYMIWYYDKVFARKMYSFYPVGGMFYLKFLHHQCLNMEECCYFALEWFDQ